MNVLEEARTTQHILYNLLRIVRLRLSQDFELRTRVLCLQGNISSIADGLKAFYIRILSNPTEPGCVGCIESCCVDYCSGSARDEVPFPQLETTISELICGIKKASRREEVI